MKEQTNISQLPNRELPMIPFYQDVIELFALSRKLHMDYHHKSNPTHKQSRLQLTITDFSQHFIQLPLIIAEAEKTKDQAKKFKAYYTIKNIIFYISLSWENLRKQSSVSSNWRDHIDAKMASLHNSYNAWSTFLTSSN